MWMTSARYIEQRNLLRPLGGRGTLAPWYCRRPATASALKRPRPCRRPPVTPGMTGKPGWFARELNGVPSPTGTLAKRKTKAGVLFHCPPGGVDPAEPRWPRASPGNDQ